MKLKLKIKGKEYEVEISESEKGKFKIKVGREEFLFDEKEKEGGEIQIAKTFFPKRDFLKKEVKAPIDGIISEILIKEGSFVKKDQKLLSLSSMKMENEIISEFEGKIKKILVKKNQKVKKDDVLIILI